MSEKRRYFRIQDSIGLAMRVVRMEKPALKLTDAETVAGQELRNVEAELNALVNALWGEDPKTAKAFGLLNRKIEILCEKRTPIASRQEDNFDIRYHNLPVSLSASGIGFVSDNSLEAGARFDIMLLLAPANMRLVVKGTVVECVPLQQDDVVRYQIRIDFVLSATEEEQLIQHIVQRQIQLLAKNDGS